MTTEPVLLLDGLSFAEGPRWHEGRLWFSDMHGGEVIAVDLDGRRETIARVPNSPSGIGFAADGTPIVVSMVDRRLMRIGPAGPEPFADLSSIATGRCNDMVVDGRGNAYVGNFGFDMFAGAEPVLAKLALVTPDGTARAVADELFFPNGTVVTPDGSTLIIGETYARRLTAFTIAEDGSLEDRRVWAPLSVPPDGICLDAEGCIWVANPLTPGGFVRVAEGGEVKDRIDLPDRGGYACMLGGPERRTLFLLEAFSSRPKDGKPGNSRIRMVEVDVPGAGWPGDPVTGT